MGRYTFAAFDKAPTPSYVVVWDLQWQVLDCQRLEPSRGPVRSYGGIKGLSTHAAGSIPANIFDPITVEIELWFNRQK